MIRCMVCLCVCVHAHTCAYLIVTLHGKKKLMGKRGRIVARVEEGPDRRLWELSRWLRVKSLEKYEQTSDLFGRWC